MGSKTGKRRTKEEEAARLIKLQQQRAAQALERQRQRLDAVNVPPEVAELPSGQDIEVTRAGEKRDRQKVDSDGARRLDAFAALKDGMQTGCFDAARKYEYQVLVRRGEADRGHNHSKVDEDIAAPAWVLKQIAAAEWIEAVNKRLPPRDWWLLVELIAPSIPRTWRETVAHITGETHTHAQGAAVRSMTVNLRDAIEAHEKAKIEARRAA
jgi:hypothetical protein